MSLASLCLRSFVRKKRTRCFIRGIRFPKQERLSASTVFSMVQYLGWLPWTTPLTAAPPLIFFSPMHHKHRLKSAKGGKENGLVVRQLPWPVTFSSHFCTELPSYNALVAVVSPQRTVYFSVLHSRGFRILARGTKPDNKPLTENKVFVSLQLDPGLFEFASLVLNSTIKSKFTWIKRFSLGIT